MNIQTPELHVIFGTGTLGKWTARELIAQGKRVRLVNRSGRADGLPAEAEVVKGDAYDQAWATQAARGAASVYQCAQPEYHEWTAKFPPLQAAILGAAIANGAKFIAAENVYMYGDPGGRPLTEDTPYRAHTRKGKVRQAMTEAIFAAHAAGQVRAAVARGSDFFGPDDRVSAGQIFQPALQGKPVNMLGRLDQPHTFTYTPDFGKALAILGTRDEALGQAWHVPSDAPVTQRQLADLIAEEAGRPLNLRPAGRLALGTLGLFNPTVRELVEMLYEFERPFVVDSAKFTRAFGAAPTPLREAVRRTVAWNRAGFGAQ
jgi:nucleoside-diphosphate-sugar epimerase